METDLLTNVRGNVQNLRNMWSSKLEQEQKPLKPRPTVYRSQHQVHKSTPRKQSIAIEIQSPTSVDETIENKQSTFTWDNSEPIEFQFVESPPPVDDFPALPPPPASIVFKQQAQSIATLKQSMAKMFDLEKKKPAFADGKTSGIHHWHIARHVFRSGLIFGPSRRASDSIIPILMKTHIAQSRSSTNSLDSNSTDTPFQTLIDYIQQNNNDQYLNVNQDKILLKRTVSDTTTCIQRNQLDDTIAQYEAIMQHLKNYDKFMATHPQAPVRKLSDIQERTLETLSEKLSLRNRQTQSLSRSAGRTFTEFVMNDLLASQSSEPRRMSTVHAASQTDINELIKKIDLLPMEDTKAALKELDTAISSVIQEPPITPNDEVNVIVVNSPVVEQEVKKETPTKEKPLMQRLFEGKKTAYKPNNLQMKSSRIPPELADTFELAKEKCFFSSERVLYATKMIKIDRRGYKQHVRILCLTSERLYIITKKKPYPKEALLFIDILGVTCTPREDGFVCVHTKETRDDRGDWIFVVDHPCEFITYLFMAMGKTNNNDHYLKIEKKFTHTRRNIATVTDECVIEARPSNDFRIAYENYDVLVIYAP